MKVVQLQSTLQKKHYTNGQSLTTQISFPWTNCFKYNLHTNRSSNQWGQFTGQCGNPFNGQWLVSWSWKGEKWSRLIRYDICDWLRKSIAFLWKHFRSQESTKSANMSVITSKGRICLRTSVVKCTSKISKVPLTKIQNFEYPSTII